MKIEQLYHTSEDHLREVKRIYLASFPADERRSFTILRRYLKCSRRPFHIIAAMKDDKVASFISYWEFADFRYIEHFATVAAMRGEGIGSKLLSDFLSQSQMPVVLEVEIPQTAMARRRIEYYTRMGFTLQKEYHYIQPPYSAEKNELEMKLMTYGDIQRGDLARYVAEIKKHVYNVKD